MRRVPDTGRTAMDPAVSILIRSRNQGASKRFTITFADPKRSCSSMLAALIGQTPHQLFDEMHLRDVFKIYDNDRIPSLVANPFVGMSYDEMLLRASLVDPEISVDRSAR